MKRSSGNGERLDDVRRMALIQRVAIIATTVIVVICCLVVRVKRHEKQEAELQRLEAIHQMDCETDSPQIEVADTLLTGADDQYKHNSLDAAAMAEKQLPPEPTYNWRDIESEDIPDDDEDREDQEDYGGYEDWEDSYDDNEEDLL